VTRVGRLTLDSRLYSLHEAEGASVAELARVTGIDRETCPSLSTATSGHPAHHPRGNTEKRTADGRWAGPPADNIPGGSSPLIGRTPPGL
jgi:hypothetical protein